MKEIAEFVCGVGALIAAVTFVVFLVIVQALLAALPLAIAGIATVAAFKFFFGA